MTNLTYKPYFAGLDVLRFLASVAVFIWHLQEHFWLDLPFTFTIDKMLGAYAVSFFFALSGFLLTYLLFVEFKKNKKINIRAFFMRRILRIWPLYYAVLILTVLYPVFLKVVLHHDLKETAHLWTYFLFVCNYDIVLGYGIKNPMLGIQWTLAVEEQFYLFLPFFFIFCKKIKNLIIFLSIAIYFFSLYYKQHVIGYIDTLSVMHSLFGGVILAALTINYNDQLKKIFNNKWFILCFVSFVSLLLMMQQFKNYSLISLLPGSSTYTILLDVYYLLLIYQFSFNQSIFNFIVKIKLSFLSHLGKDYTFALYLIHPMAITISTLIIKEVCKINSFAVYMVFTTFLCVILCWLSKKYIEDPMLSLKNKWN